jgi:glutamate-1-semialdehyde 2,1-aminomutase
MAARSRSRPVGAALGTSFARSTSHSARASQLIPGGAHTYAKGADQYPEHAPLIIERGEGCRVWDLDGNEFIEYGMGLRAVTLGHAFGPVVEAVTRELGRGSNYSRPAAIELECAELLAEIIPGAEMVKFCKDGSHAVDSALKLARAHTGRDMIAACADHPFFSTSDWFIGSTEMPGGIPDWIRQHTLRFPYNDADALDALLRAWPGRIAAVILEAARTDEPAPGYLQQVQALCRKHGAVFVIDEMITGFRWHLAGAQGCYGITPDLSTFGKAMANGFSVSALVGRRELMELGGSDHERQRVFLMSTTHGGETHGLAAAIATMEFYRANPVIETLYARGRQLRDGVQGVIRARGLEDHFRLVGRDCGLLYATFDENRRPSQAYRTLFLQEMIDRGVLSPSFVVSYSHSEMDIDSTVAIVAEVLDVYARALREGIDRYLRGRPVKPALRDYS